MAIAYQTNADGAGASGTSNTATFGSALTAGWMIAVSIDVRAQGRTVTVTDTEGNTYLIARSQIQSTRASQSYVAYAFNIAGGGAAGNVVTVAISGGAAFIRFACHAFSPSAGMTFALDQVNSAEGSGNTTPASGNVTTTVASELLYGGIINVTNSAVLTPGAGFTGLANMEFAIWSEYQIVSSTGTFNADGGWSANDDWTAIIATFAETPVGPGFIPSTLARVMAPILAQ